MGREVKRVPLDFDQPLNEVWPGFFEEPETAPPTGDGYQLWETVSEGSPISPVFATPEELATWMTRNRCTVNGPMSSYDAALRFVEAGWAPSFVSGPDIGFLSGTEWVGRADR